MYGRFEDSQIQNFIEVAFVAVDEGVVVAAEQTEVGEHGFAAVGPRNDVVDVTPSWGAGAAGPGAVPVADDDRSPQRRGDHTGTPTDIANLRRTVPDDAGDRAPVVEDLLCFFWAVADDLEQNRLRIGVSVRHPFGSLE